MAADRCGPSPRTAPSAVADAMFTSTGRPTTKTSSMASCRTDPSSTITQVPPARVWCSRSQPTRPLPPGHPPTGRDVKQGESPAPEHHLEPRPQPVHRHHRWDHTASREHHRGHDKQHAHHADHAPVRPVGPPSVRSGARAPRSIGRGIVLGTPAREQVRTHAGSGDPCLSPAGSMPATGM